MASYIGNSQTLQSEQRLLTSAGVPDPGENATGYTAITGANRKNNPGQATSPHKGHVDKTCKVKETPTRRSLCIADEKEVFSSMGAQIKLFPFLCQERKIYTVNPSTQLFLRGLRNIPDDVFFPFNRPMTVYEKNVNERLVNLLEKGLSGVCQVGNKDRTFILGASIYQGPTPMEDIEIGMCCYHLVNYLAFGMTYQVTQLQGNIQSWYCGLPFVHVIPFDENKLQWGDIVLLENNEKASHCAFYLGGNKYINKLGFTGVYIQDFDTISEWYQASRLIVVRLKKEHYGNVFEFVWEENAVCSTVESC